MINAPHNISSKELTLFLYSWVNESMHPKILNDLMMGIGFKKPWVFKGKFWHFQFEYLLVLYAVTEICLLKFLKTKSEKYEMVAEGFMDDLLFMMYPKLFPEREHAGVFHWIDAVKERYSLYITTKALLEYDQASKIFLSKTVKRDSIEGLIFMNTLLQAQLFSLTNTLSNYDILDIKDCEKKYDLYNDEDEMDDDTEDEDEDEDEERINDDEKWDRYQKKILKNKEFK